MSQPIYDTKQGWPKIFAKTSNDCFLFLL